MNKKVAQGEPAYLEVDGRISALYNAPGGAKVRKAERP